MTQTENALVDLRAEYVEETTVGETPADPNWTTISDSLTSVPGWTPDASSESTTPVGEDSTQYVFRGIETHDFELAYWLTRFPVDGSNNVVDPSGYPFEYAGGDDFPTLTMEFRKDIASGGNDGAGFRQYTIGRGCKVLSTTLPGSPDDSSPVTAELSIGVRKARSYIIHQPSSSTTLDVVSTSANDTSQTVTIESEDASTTDTVTLNGTTAQTTTESFADVDVINVDGDHEGDITVTDGSGTDILEGSLAGSNTDGVDSEVGLAPLGTGSHGSAIGNNPDDYLFLSTSSTYGGGDLASRVHGLNVTAELEDERNGLQGTREQAIDPGVRTTTAEATVASPFESTTQIENYLTSNQADLVYTYPGGTITLKNALITDVDDQTFEAGEANNLVDVTFTAQRETDADDVILSTT